MRYYCTRRQGAAPPLSTRSRARWKKTHRLGRLALGGGFHLPRLERVDKDQPRRLLGLLQATHNILIYLWSTNVVAMSPANPPGERLYPPNVRRWSPPGARLAHLRMSHLRPCFSSCFFVMGLVPCSWDMTTRQAETGLTPFYHMCGQIFAFSTRQTIDHLLLLSLQILLNCARLRPPFILSSCRYPLPTGKRKKKQAKRGRPGHRSSDLVGGGCRRLARLPDLGRSPGTFSGTVLYVRTYIQYLLTRTAV